MYVCAVRACAWVLVYLYLYVVYMYNLRCTRQIKSISLFQQRMKAFLAKCDNDYDYDDYGRDDDDDNNTTAHRKIV